MYGYLALNPKGFGHLRHQAAAGRQDPYLSANLVRDMGLREGDYIDALATWSDRGPAVSIVGRSIPIPCRNGVA